jgi:hypothetical protein
VRDVNASFPAFYSVIPSIAALCGHAYAWDVVVGWVALFAVLAFIITMASCYGGYVIAQRASLHPKFVSFLEARENKLGWIVNP